MLLLGEDVLRQAAHDRGEYRDRRHYIGRGSLLAPRGSHRKHDPRKHHGMADGGVGEPKLRESATVRSQSVAVFRTVRDLTLELDVILLSSRLDSQRGGETCANGCHAGAEFTHAKYRGKGQDRLVIG